jgi:ABC-type uncharacterized transport system ATPase subunit
MTQTNSSRQPLLSIRDLSIALPAGGDRAHAVKDISYDLHAGEILHRRGIRLGKIDERQRDHGPAAELPEA